MMFMGSDPSTGKKRMNYQVKMIWDPESAVWIATSEDVPGLILESGPFDVLVERVRYAVPELLELNGEKHDTYNLTYLTQKEDQVAV